MRHHEDDHPDLEMLAAFVHARLASCDAIDDDGHAGNCADIVAALSASPRARALASELLTLPPEAMADGLYGPTFGQLALQRRVLWIEGQLRDALGLREPEVAASAVRRRRRLFRLR